MKYLLLILTLLISLSTVAREPAGVFSYTDETGVSIEDFDNEEDFHERRTHWEQELEEEMSNKEKNNEDSLVQRD